MKSEFKDLLLKYCTARLDIKNFGTSESKIIILKNSDLNAKVHQPPWFTNEDGIGTIIESNEGLLDLEIKCVTQGILNFAFRGIDFRDKNNKRFPIFIDYTNIIINDEKIIDETKSVCHDKPYVFKRNVNADEILRIHVEWIPFNNSSEYVFENLNTIQAKEIKSLKETISINDKQLKSIPQLSCTSLGYSAFNGKLIYRNMLGLSPERSILNDINGFCENHWFTNYFKHKFPNEDFKIGIFGVCNAHDNLKYPLDEKKILYSPEDLNYRFLEMKIHYDKYALDYVDLAMGYDLIDHPKYIRFPYWFIWHFPPNITDEGIEKTIDLWNSASYEKTQDVVAIASHDLWGTRTMIDNDITSFLDITYAGKWKNSTSDLWNKFNNNKQEYMKQFKFNLCAENLISDGYVTEKIFDAIRADCIPLYAGGGNYLEPEVLNPNAIIRWDGDDRNITSDSLRNRLAYHGVPAHSKGKWYPNDDFNSDSVELLKNIITDEKTYNEFKDQDKLLSSSKKFIINKFSELEKQIERVIYS